MRVFTYVESMFLSRGLSKWNPQSSGQLNSRLNNGTRIHVN